MEQSAPIQEVIISWSQVAFYIVTTIGLITAAILGIIKYRIFRTTRPFINITLEASSRAASPDYIQIGVTANLYNGSRVLAKVEELTWICRSIGIYDSEEIRNKMEEHFFRNIGKHTEFPWNIQHARVSPNLNIQIEPNESATEHTTFIVPMYCTAVQITLFIPTYEDYKTGWKATIFHDINTMKENRS